VIYTAECLASLPPLRRRSPRAHNIALRTDLPIKRLKEVLEKYVAEMPAPDRAKVTARLQSSNDECFISAKYGVLLYAFFRSRGWTVELNVPVASGDADLLVRADGTGSSLR